MSGTETLLPYIKDENEEKPTIIVDSREASSAPKIVKGLREAGAEIKIQALPKGDYVLSDCCAVERKTVSDFVYTLTRRYLFEQLFMLKEAYSKPIILIEGYLPIIYKFSKIKPSSVWGAMFALAKNGIAMIHTTTYKETVDFLYTVCDNAQMRASERRNTIRVEVSEETLYHLLVEGHVCAADLRCLDHTSKVRLLRLCLESCMAPFFDRFPKKPKGINSSTGIKTCVFIR